MPSESDGALNVVRERQSLHSLWIVAIATGTAVALAVCMTGLWLFFFAQGKPGVRPAETFFPGPGLQSDPAGDLHALETAQKKQLDSYAWIDRERDIVQVPIERAMQLVVARGKQAYDPIGHSP